MTEEEKAIEAAAIEFARRNKKAIAARLTDPATYKPEAFPVSVFMAGSPGAGKTETSIALIDQIDGGPVLRIDPDDLRIEFAAYDGKNASLFQRGVAVIVDKIHDLALSQKQSFLLDGTFANFEKSKLNVERSIKKGRKVQVLYVYQEPLQAWTFVKAREELEGRRIPEDDFVNQYFGARDVVNKIKANFGKDVSVDLLLKNIDNTNKFYRAGVDSIDHYIPEKYSRKDVVELILGYENAVSKKIQRQ